METEFDYKPQGTCSVLMKFMIEDSDDTIQSFQVLGGCNGNLKGLGALMKGRKVQDVIRCLSGIRCGSKSTSCPDQAAKALQLYLDSKKVE